MSLHKLHLLLFSTHLCLEKLELLEHGVVHTQLGVPHEHTVPVLTANTVRQIAQVLQEVTTSNNKVIEEVNKLKK